MRTPRIVIAGGGFAGLETAFTLRFHLGDRVRLALIADRADFLFKPNTIYLPFGGDEDRLHIPLARPLARRHIDFHQGSLTGVDVDHKLAELGDGTRSRYDFLVLATGAAMRPDEIPGLAEHAQTIWTPGQMRALGGHLAKLRAAVQAGERQRVLFLVPPGNKCAGPLYEIVFMLENWLRRNDLRDETDIAFTTSEGAFVQAFGPRLHQLVCNEFDTRGIDGQTGTVVTRVEPGQVHYEGGSIRPYDLLVSFPPYVAAATYHGLPADDRGFLHTDQGTRRVHGTDDIYAPGDAGDFPVKQAFLAFLQAGAVADDIASRLSTTAVRLPRRFDPVSMCVMEMSAEPGLRDARYDKAAFGQVPLELTGDPRRPVRVRDGSPGDYLVGAAPIWRLGKRALGVYLPWRFKAGRPFHSGAPWQGMELGLTAMARAFATPAGPKGDLSG